MAASNLDLNSSLRETVPPVYGQLPVTAGIGMRDGGAKNVIGILYRSPVVAVAGRLQGTDQQGDFARRRSKPLTSTDTRQRHTTCAIRHRRRLIILIGAGLPAPLSSDEPKALMSEVEKLRHCAQLRERRGHQ